MQKFPNENQVLPLLGIFLALILAVRLVSLHFNNTELFFDEAQYWYWAQSPAFGYFSKPPVLAWIIYSSTSLCGSDSTFCIRLASPLLHTVTAFFVYLSAAELFDRRTGFWAAVIFATVPGITLSATLASTDVPLLMFWSIALYAYIRMTRDKGDRGLGWAVVFGAAFGLGLMSKYAMAYFLACAFVHALIERKPDHPVLSYRFWLGCGIGLAILVPNILWNMQNAFVTLSHTGENIGWSGVRFNFVNAAEFLGSQFGVMGPILFGVYLATLWASRKGNLTSPHRLLIAFSATIILVIVAQALMSKAYANWAATAYIAACILVADIMVNRIPGFWLRLSMALHMAVFAALAVAVGFAGPGQIVLANGVQPFARMQGQSEIARKTAMALDADDYQAVLTANRKISALMNYYLRDRKEPVLAWRASTAPGDHYQLVSAYQGQARAGPVLLVSRTSNPKNILSQFGETELLGKQSISAGTTRSIFFFKLDKYEGPGATQ